MASDKRFEAVPAEYAKERFIDDLERVLKSLKLIPCKTIMDIGSGILTNTKFMGLTLNFEEEDFIIAEKKEDKSECNNEEKKEDEEKFNDVSEFFLFQAKKDSRLAISFAKIYLNKIDASSQVTDNEAVHSIIKDLVKIVKFRDVSANISESSLESFSDLEISPQRKSSENSNGGSTSSPVSFPKSDIKPEVSTPSPPKLQVERKFKEESLHFSAYEKPDGAASCDVQLFLDEESEQKSITPEKNCNEREAKLRTPPTPPDGKCKKSKNQH